MSLSKPNPIFHFLSFFCKVIFFLSFLSFHCLFLHHFLFCTSVSSLCLSQHFIKPNTPYPVSPQNPLFLLTSTFASPTPPSQFSSAPLLFRNLYFIWKIPGISVAFRLPRLILFLNLSGLDLFFFVTFFRLIFLVGICPFCVLAT